MTNPTSPAPAFTSAALTYTNDAGVMIQNTVQVSTPSNPDPVSAGAEGFNAYYGNPANSAAPTG